MNYRYPTLKNPLLLGFSEFERSLELLSKGTQDGYPPHNLEQIGTNGLRITLAVAGFRIEDLSIELEQNQLTIRGKQKNVPDRVYIHRGIASRQFQKSFVLAEGIEIIGASLEDGLLHIDLQQPTPKNKIQKITIKNKQNTQKNVDIKK